MNNVFINFLHALALSLKQVPLLEGKGARTSLAEDKVSAPAGRRATYLAAGVESWEPAAEVRRRLRRCSCQSSRGSPLIH